jgi:membrane protein DedA with SNARE-associated domain
MPLEEWVVQFQQWSQEVVGAWGYLGVFLVSLVGNATIILPLPSIVVVFFAGTFLNPWLVGIAAGAGSALGEMTGYLLGRGGRKVAEKRQHKWIKRTKHWIRKGGVFPIIVLFAATPLPDDVAGAAAGLLKYDWKKFLVAAFIGKTIMCLAVSLAGFYGAGWVFSYISGS